MELPKRKSPRADWYDYAGGMYFVTVVTRNRNKYFGEINNGVMSRVIRPVLDLKC